MNLVLSPFIELIKQIFLFSFELTQNYGWSIILLSFTISALLLPIFILIEKSKKKNDVVKFKMQPLVDEIKRCYKGQERYYYLKTLNRQFNYSPFRAMIPILSLVLQIPFFIAAYQYLAHFEPLKNVTFGFIADLSAPDKLLGGLNFLPIAMTLVNLITAYFYTRNGDGAERKQMLIVAGIFLILLFNLPSGLVLYWTMNNVFSFFRLFITNPEVFKRLENTEKAPNTTFIEFRDRLVQMLPRIFNTVYILAAFSILFQLIWAFQHSFTNIFYRIFTGLLVSTLISFILGLTAASFKINTPTKNLNLKALFYQLWPQFKPVFILILSIGIISQLNWALKYSFDNLPARLIMATLGSSLVTLFLALLVLLYTGNLLVPIKKDDFKLSNFSFAYKILLISLIISSAILHINWAYHHVFKDIVIRLSLSLISSYAITIVLANIIKYQKKNGFLSWSTISKANIKPTVNYSLLFLSIYLFAASKLYYSGYNQILGILAMVFLIPSQFIGYIQLQKNVRKYSTLIKTLAAIGFFGLVGIQILNLLLDAQNISESKLLSQLDLIITYYPLNGFLFFGLFAAFITLPFYPKQNTASKLTGFKSNLFSYSLAILYLAGFVFLWNPLSIYSSYPAIFEFPAIEILQNNTLLFVTSFASLFIVYLILPKQIKPYGFIAILVIAALSFIHNTLLPINVGTLQETKFLNQDNLALPELIYLLEAFAIILLIALTVYILEKQYFKQLKWGLVLINFVLISQSLVQALNTESFFTKHKISTTNSNSISFSKEKENVVFVILDMFHGWYMDRILTENTNLFKTLDGFKWYPNTLAVSSITSSSISPVLGGFDYTIDKLNKQSNENLEIKITEVTQNFYNKVKSKGFDFTATKLIYSTLDENSFDTYLPPWNDTWDEWNGKLHIGLEKEIGFTLLWENAAFYSAPLLLKPKIYNKGNWFHGNVQTNENTNAAKPYNFLRILPYISNTENKDPNFIYLHSMASHHPWDIIEDNGKFKPNVSVYENNKWTIETLSQWISWMKENGVYNNTKIVVVSDHGPHWWHYKGDIDLEIPTTPNPALKIDAKVHMQLFALMLVKDYNKTGKLEKDWRFMSNADASAIVFDENDPTKGEAPITRTLPSSVVAWERKIWELNELKIEYQFEAKDNVFDLTRWKRLK